MTEKNTAGREPLSVVTLDADKCTRTWARAPCNAGRNNLLPQNSDFLDPALWDVDGYTPTETFGDVWNFRFTASGSSPYQMTFLGDIQPLAGEDLYISARISEVSGSAHSIVCVLVADGITYDFLYNSNTDTMTTPFQNNAFDSVDHGPTGSGQFYFDCRLDAAKLANGISSFYFRPTNDTAYPFLSGEQDVWPIQFSTTPAAWEEPILTTGDPVLAVSNEPCFNTRSTCQDPNNYDLGVQPIKFVKSQAQALRDDYYIPSLASVSISPAKLNPGGANKSISALGKRAEISVTFKDHPHTDRLVDPYVDLRDYDPLERSTFWSKWRARNPYYMHRGLKFESGYYKDGALVESTLRSFVMTKFSGPDSNGNVTIQGKDVLTMAEDAKAQAPLASTGSLFADLTDVALGAQLQPAGVGDLEYPASGTLRIGKEVMTFTRSGDTLTFTGRGTDGTTAQEHSEGDNVQLCLRYAAQSPQDILYDLLLNYAGIPASFLDKAQWDAEALAFLPRLYTALIVEPEGVSKLISEMCEQMYFTVWYDERSGLVKIRAVRPAEDDPVTELNGDNAIVADSVTWEDLSDDLITRVWVYHGRLDPTEKLDQADNYAAIEVSADLEGETSSKQNIKRVKKIYSRWIDAGNAAAAIDLGQSIINRHSNIPRKCTFSLDGKDQALWLGDFIQVTNRLRTNEFGVPVPVNMQVFTAQEASIGTRFTYTAQEFIASLGDDVTDPTARNVVITSDFLNVDLRALHDSQYGTAPESGDTVTFTIRAGVTIGSDCIGGGVNIPLAARNTANDSYAAGSAYQGVDAGDLPPLQRASVGVVTDTAAGAAYHGGGTVGVRTIEYPLNAALRTGAWPAGVNVVLIIEAGAQILGEGGNGSAHWKTASEVLGVPPATNDIIQHLGPRQSVPGGDGCPAMEINHAISITNGGTIAGGGGGGGSSIQYMIVSGLYATIRGGSGGGGAGATLSRVRLNPIANNPNGGGVTEASGGSLSAGGNGGAHSTVTKAWFIPDIYEAYNLENTAENSFGGALAEAGKEGFWRASSGGGFSDSTNVVNGSLPGEAISAGANLVTWVNKGDVRGAEIV